LIGLLLVANVVALFIGLTGDSVTVGTTMRKGFGGFSVRLLDTRETFSILSSIGELWSGGNSILAAIILLFSVLFPIAKLAANTVIWIRLMRPARHEPGWMRHTARVLHRLGRWSMLDVFVVGILCVWGKLGDVTRFMIEPAMYWFFAAVILSIANALLTEKALLTSSDYPLSRAKV
jgi:paraquat-inducible protein A